MNKTKAVLIVALLCSLAAWTKAQTCILASCSASACPDGCTGCSSATLTQLTEGRTSELCPKSGSFCFLGRVSNGVCTIQNCDACASSDPSSCTGCKQVTSNNSNANHCDNDQCYSMSYTSVSAGSPPPPPTANAPSVTTVGVPTSSVSSTSVSSSSSSSGNSASTGNVCILSSCNSIDCPNGCANCASATQWTIPTNGRAVQVCPNNASFCFTGARSDNVCTISNCDGCSTGDASSCINCQALTSNSSNKDWCLNGNCYHMQYSSAGNTGSSTTSSAQGNGVGPSNSPPNDQSLNCELLQCNAADCPNGCDGCSKATSVAITENISQLCPANGSFCFIASSSNGVCMISSCKYCGNTVNTCTGCEAVTAQNSVSNFCSNSLCYHMGYTETLGGSVGASSSNSTNNNTNNNGTAVNNTNGIGSGSNTNGNLSSGNVISSGLLIHVSSLLMAVVVGGLMVAF